jgi:serine/threonine protein kinase
VSVKLIRCGPFANQSERHAAEYLKVRLESVAGGADWVLLTNYANSSGAHHLSDELDLVVIGPPGVFIVEVKHWSAADIKRPSPGAAEHEADKLNAKAKRLAGRLRKVLPFDVGFVEGKLLLTRSEGDKFVEGAGRKRVRGIDVFGLAEWRDLLGTYRLPVLNDSQVAATTRFLQPQVPPQDQEDLRSFEDFYELEPVKGPRDPFHRVYRARRKPTRDRVILHIYDLSAIDDKNPLEVARREFDALQRLQKSPWLPSLMDSFQEASGYPGELYLFSYVDTEAASLAERAGDAGWPVTERVETAKLCVEALADLHRREATDSGETVLHRNVNPESIRIRSNGEPLLTQLHSARIPGAVTVSGAVATDFRGAERFVAPEVLTQGIGASTVASDVFALCATLHVLFEEEQDDPEARRVLDVLSAGTASDPARRIGLDELLGKLEDMPRATTQPRRIPVQFWDEDTVKEFHKRSYRVVTRLGAGGVGTTFKVMEVDPATGEELSGPYVAKAITNQQVGVAASKAYARVRAQTGGPHLAGVLEVASQWERDEITALLRWVKGDPMSEWTGALPLYLDELGEGPREEVALRWLRDLCEGLAQLHQVGLVHGDVSPRNIIVDGGDVTLTDFDLAGAAGMVPLGKNHHYSAPDVEAGVAVNPSDDLFALAATFFHVLFDRYPFPQYGAGLDKRHGLNWGDVDRQEWQRVALFLDRGTHPDHTQRFDSAMEAIAFLDSGLTAEPAGAVNEAAEAAAVIELPPVLTDNVVPWLEQLLQSYPGSPRGNAETRGLDSPFARQTYVETKLDAVLTEDVREGKVSLVVLCGNAGDGKTAFLQNLASKLGLDPGTSAKRLWDYVLPNGVRIRANLDGSAAYQGRSAGELLNEFFAPFGSEAFPEKLVHLIAINDGPLLAWLNEGGESYLTAQLYAALDTEGVAEIDPRIRFVDLNARSLVGGYSQDARGVSTDFIDSLLEKMLGPGEETWRPCHTCTAQSRCHAWRSARTLLSPDFGRVVRDRLAKALLAVHQRGEMHITARSLRAALTYIFFGTYYCLDLHADPGFRPEFYYDRAFDPGSPHRQGELLRELQWLDPALESHPHVDSYLLREEGGDDGLQSFERDLAPLDSLRRRAYFEWPEKKIVRVGGNASALGLARGQHMDAFLKVATGTEAEREVIRDAVCDGIARLEDLPEDAFGDRRWVPLKITPRTPTETAFWVNKPRERFSLRPRRPRAAQGVETLHTHVILTYQFEAGHEEHLAINAELFHLLMELKDGYQISDTQSDDVFANLSIFKQRLAQEGDRALMAWNPLEGRAFEVRADWADGSQRLMIEGAAAEAFR